MRCVRGILLVVLTITMHGQIMAQEAAVSGRTVDQNGVIHLDQNWKSGWDDTGKNWYHHATQGAFMLPYEWFMALEQPTSDVPPKETGLFSDQTFLSRFGFLSSEQNPEYNPDNLPIGFAISKAWDDPNTEATDPLKVLGLTCAACHTGEVQYEGKKLRIEGGSAMINLGEFQKAMSLSIFVTNASAAKFERFASRILGPKNLPPESLPTARAMLKAGLEAALAKGLKQSEIEKQAGIGGVEGGFSRTDALSKIGNNVFGKLSPVNLQDSGAPVNFPHVWDTPWFDWVQYNGSIRLPMIRNIGEALGLGAAVKVTPAGATDISNYVSTVDIENLHKMELLLAGERPFAGLRAPAWPEDVLGEIKGFRGQNGLWAEGKRLYSELCVDCHQLTEDYQSHFSDRGQSIYWTESNRFQQRFMKSPMVNIVDIGTDPATALKFYRRIVYTGAMREDDVQIVPAFEGLTTATMEVRKKAYSLMKLSQKQMDEFDGYREMPNELGEGEPGALAPLEYKARTLDGIWATAPFLHNGSVPNIYELLLPVAERSSNFYIGSTKFDPVNVGFETKWSPGAFLLNTTIAGNLNSGHEFRDETADERKSLAAYSPLAEDSSPDADSEARRRRRSADVDRIKTAINGRVGRKLEDSERYAIIEYVKSLGSPIPPAKVIGQEYPPDNEADAIKTLGVALGAAQAADYNQRVQGADDKPVIAVRGQHPKQHGAVFARFRVEPNMNLPANVQVGLFREEKEYTAVIRFSSGDSFLDAGTDELGMPILDVQGMAIKVLIPDQNDSSKNVSQDFVMANHEVFLARDVAQLWEFVQVSGAYKQEKNVLVEKFGEDKDGLKAELMPVYGKYVDLLKLRFPEALRFKSEAPASPLQATYWSQTPYRLGPDQAVKYVVVPRNFDIKLSSERSSDFLKEAMVQQLTTHKIPASFDFYVQLQTDADKMPIEDPTESWGDAKIKVATLTIYPQKFDSEAQMKFCEDLSFSPWQALPEHAPLGGINRARNPIYEASSAFRHDKNMVERKEPTGHESF